jgi:hypothetical protein
MHIKIINRTISALYLALILFYFSSKAAASLPLTETIYTIPDSGMNLSLREEFIKLGSYHRKDNFSLGIGIMPEISIWYSFDYLHNKIINSSANALGDSYIKIWYYMGDYFKICHAGFMTFFRLPTGPDAYTDDKWRNLSFGNNELKVGPVFKFDLKNSIFVHANIFYVFRQGQDEGFYSGFHLNPTKKEAYSNVFGLNFRSKEAFLSNDRLKNDYAVFSAAVNTSFFFRATNIIPYMEFYASHRVYKKRTNKYENIPIEGAGINPVFVSGGGRYFFSDDIFFGFYYIINPKREKKFIKNTAGFDFSLQF